MDLILALLIGIIGSAMVAYFWDKCPRMARWIIRRSAARLPDGKRWEQEWLNDLEYQDGRFDMFLHGLGCARASFILNHDLRRSFQYMVMEAIVLPYRIQNRWFHHKCKRLDQAMDLALASPGIASTTEALRRARQALREADRRRRMECFYRRVCGQKAPYPEDIALTACKSWVEQLTKLVGTSK